MEDIINSWYRKLRKTFSKLSQTQKKLISRFHIGLKTFLREGLLEPEFNGDLVYKAFKTLIRNYFSFQLRKSLHVTDVSVIT